MSPEHAWRRAAAQFIAACFVTGALLGLLGAAAIEWRARR